MKKILINWALVFIVFLFGLLQGCSVSEPVEIKANKATLEVVEKWGPDVCFFTLRSKPARSLSGLKPGDLACAGANFYYSMVELQKAAAVEGSDTVRIVMHGSLKENPPRVYVTWCSYKSDETMKRYVRAILVAE